MEAKAINPNRGVRTLILVSGILAIFPCLLLFCMAEASLPPYKNKFLYLPLEWWFIFIPVGIVLALISGVTGLVTLRSAKEKIGKRVGRVGCLLGSMGVIWQLLALLLASMVPADVAPPSPASMNAFMESSSIPVDVTYTSYGEGFNVEFVIMCKWPGDGYQQPGSHVFTALKHMYREGYEFEDRVTEIYIMEYDKDDTPRGRIAATGEDLMAWFEDEISDEQFRQRLQFSSYP